MKLQPLGDQAILAQFPNEQSAARFAASLRQTMQPGWLDIVCSYTSVAVIYDVDHVRYEQVRAHLDQHQPDASHDATGAGTLHRIPCCYEYQLDLARVASITGLSEDAIIAAHLATEYQIFAIGFCPGFPYLGYLPDALSGVPRLDSPRIQVEPGSVGLTGRQTGIYPLPRPGGWNLIGRTPLQLVDLADAYFPLRVGDRVRFERIDEMRYRQLNGERLPTARSATTETK